jgi:hypothetical protein
MLPTDLIAGPYKPPALKRGDRAFCLFRDCEVKVTSWSNAPLQWPRCQRMGQHGGSGLLVTDELVRAIRSESSAALQYWFGVGIETVWRWRKFFGVEMWGTEGSKRLHQQLSQVGGDAMRGTTVPPYVIAKRRATRQANGKCWTKEEVALLGLLPDDEVARRTGRTLNAVMLKRQRRSK